MSIDWFTFVAQIINFLVLLYLLKRFLYAPITNAMQAREQRVADQLTEAEQKKASAESLIEEYHRRSAELENDRHRMFESVKTEVEESRKQLLKQARSEVESRREDWLASLHREQDTLSQIVRQRCGEQVANATRQALHELADAELEEQMLRTFVQKLGVDGPQPTSKHSAAHNGPHMANVYTAFEVTPIWQERLKTALTQQFQLAEVTFQVSTDIVCGIEVHVGSEKIGWSVEEYLATLEEEFGRLVEQPTS